MQVHGTHLNRAALNPYSAAEVEEIAAAKRAAEVRKKLLSVGAESEGEAEVEAIPATGEADDEASPQDQKQEHGSDTSDAAKDEAARNEAGNEGEAGDAISIWG